MVKRVALPDGSTGEFPDGMPDDQIEAVLRRQFGKREPTQAEIDAVSPAKDMNWVEKLAVGAGAATDRALRGVRDLVGNVIGGEGGYVPPGTGKEDAELYQKYHPGGWATTGELGADVAMSAIPVSRAGNLAANILRSRAGSLAPALGDVAANAGYAALTAPEDRGEAAAWGAGGAAAPRVLMRALRGVTPGPQAKLLQDKDIVPTFGQVAAEKWGTPGQAILKTEEALANVPLTGRYLPAFKEKQREAFQALTRQEAHPERLPADSLDKLRQAFNTRYGQVLGNSFKELDPKGFDWEEAVHLATDTPEIFTKVSKKVANTFDRALEVNQGALTPRMAHAVESRLESMASRYQRSLDPDHKDVGDAIADVSQEFGSWWRSRLEPHVLDQIKELDSRYAKFVPLRKAGLTGAEAAVKPEGYTPKLLLQAIRASDRSMNKTGFLEGNRPQQKLTQAAEDVLGSNSYQANGFKPFATALAVGSIPVGHAATAATAIGLSGLYSLPFIQKLLTGQQADQKLFFATLDQLPVENRQAFMELVTNIARARATQQGQ